MVSTGHKEGEMDGHHPHTHHCDSGSDLLGSVPPSPQCAPDGQSPGPTWEAPRRRPPAVTDGPNQVTLSQGQEGETLAQACPHLGWIRRGSRPAPERLGLPRGTSPQPAKEELGQMWSQVASYMQLKGWVCGHCPEPRFGQPEVPTGAWHGICAQGSWHESFPGFLQ